MSRVKAICFSVILIATFLAPPILTLIESGDHIHLLSFCDDEEKKENKNADGDENEIILVVSTTSHLTTSSLKNKDKENFLFNYTNLSMDIFLPPPKKSSNITV